MYSVLGRTWRKWQARLVERQINCRLESCLQYCLRVWLSLVERDYATVEVTAEACDTPTRIQTARALDTRCNPRLNHCLFKGIEVLGWKFGECNRKFTCMVLHICSQLNRTIL